MKNDSSVIDVKIEYCRKCGSCLDANRRCTGCGKQYFHMKKGVLLKLYAFYLTVMAVVLACENNRNVRNAHDWINLYNEANTAKQELQQKLEDSEDLRRGLKDKNDWLSKDYIDLVNEKNAAESEVKFYEERFVCVTTTGSKYHKHTCYHIANSSGHVIYLREAKKRGYTACADCWQ